VAEFSELINATDNPARTAALVNKVLNPDTPPPVMEQPQPDEVELPCGLMVDGQLVRTARVKELTGAVEEQMARAQMSNNPERMFNVLLLGGLVDIGGHKPDEALVERMVLGDREAIMLGIRKVTYGPEIEYEEYTCEQCRAKFELTISIDEIPVVRAENPGNLEFFVELKHGRRARVRHVTGADHLAIMALERQEKLTPAERDTAWLARCVLALIDPQGNERLVHGNKQAMRDLGLADRAKILDELTNKRPGPRLNEVKVTCPDCGHTSDFIVAINALFRY